MLATQQEVYQPLKQREIGEINNNKIIIQEISPTAYTFTKNNDQFIIPTLSEDGTELEGAKEIVVLSLDADGCTLREDNTNLFSAVKKLLEKENNVYVICTVGSNRQDRACDAFNGLPVGFRLRSGSFFPALLGIMATLQNKNSNATFILDPFLLADMYAKKTAGTNFHTAIKYLCERKDDNPMDEKEIQDNIQKDCDRWAFDESKVTILFAQTHRIAHIVRTKNLTARISFNF